MSANILMNVSELAKEIDISEITLNFWLKRFSKWLPYIIEKEKKLYSPEILTRLIFIAERMNAKMIPSEIENDLKKKFSLDPDKDTMHNSLEDALSLSMEHGLFSKQNVQIIGSLLQAISSNQERIAKANEKRADVEERKTKAIEKRAEAEEKKAWAMNNIANALQNMKHEVWPLNTENQIAGETARAIALDDSSLEGLYSKKTYAEKLYPNKGLDNNLDNLSDLVDTDYGAETMDSRAAMNGVSTIDSHKTGSTPESIDDLSLLIEKESYPPADISSKAKNFPLEKVAKKDMSRPDDNKLNLDDLSALIDVDNTIGTKAGDADKPDDLSILIDVDTDNTMDNPAESDISADSDRTSHNFHGNTLNNDDLDDLSMLIDDEPENQMPKKSDLLPSVTLEENFNQYKTEIINSIIKLKKEGLGVKETTERFNEAGIKTLSGKSRWSSKTIAKIYKFIESVS